MKNEKKKTPFKYSGNTLFESNLETVKKKIQSISNINELKHLSEEESKYYDRPGFHNAVRSRIEEIETQNRIVTDGLIDIAVFDRLVNKIPWCDPEKEKEPLDKEIKEKIIQRDNHKCPLCKGNSNDDGLAVHHIIPNGPATEENLMLLCNFCHDKIHLFLSKKGYRYYKGQRYYW